MRPDMKKLSTFSVLAIATILSGAISSGKDGCAPGKSATCYPDDCQRCYCLGPETIIANSPVGPLTCDGDFVVTVALMAWQANQDGMEYAINNQVFGDDSAHDNRDLNNLIDAAYRKPGSSWDPGFKLGVSYASACDGWDVGVLWTFFQNSTKTHDEAEQSDNHTLLPLWSAFQFPHTGLSPILFATDIESHWKVDLNLVDIELGRKFWVSHYLAFRPHVGLRYASINQDLDLFHKGGSWNDLSSAGKKHFLGEVQLDNDFHGLGVRAGFDTNWNVGCGWALYGNLALSLLYGRFSIDQQEIIREAESPFTKVRILETKDRLHASRASFDLGLGLQWSALVCDCKYGLMLALGWEEHVFFHQNQLWRVNRLGGNDEGTFINNTGENVHLQRRGNLSTRGITLTGKFSF